MLIHIGNFKNQEAQADLGDAMAYMINNLFKNPGEPDDELKYRIKKGRSFRPLKGDSHQGPKRQGDKLELQKRAKTIKENDGRKFKHKILYTVSLPKL